MTDRAKSLAGTVPDDAFDVAVDMLTREQRRSRRKREVRARTISVERMTKRERELGRLLFPAESYWRPTTRGECDDVPRPCPFVSCRYHLFVDVSPKNGTIKLNFPDLEPDQLIESCCLDVADRGGDSLENVGAFLNLTRERVRQLETLAMVRVRDQAEAELLDHVGDEPRTAVRTLPEES